LAGFCSDSQFGSETKGPKAVRVMNAMMGMVKLDIAAMGGLGDGK
jgi:hypothetical protein